MDIKDIAEEAYKNGYKAGEKESKEKFAKRLADWFVDKTAKHPDKLWLIITLAEWHKMIEEIYNVE